MNSSIPVIFIACSFDIAHEECVRPSYRNRGVPADDVGDWPIGTIIRGGGTTIVVCRRMIRANGGECIRQDYSPLPWRAGG